MALNKEVLENDILSVFSSMTDGDDSVFSDGVSAAFKSFVESGLPSTTDTGTVYVPAASSSGTFTGASTTGSLSTSDSTCASIIYSAFSFMKANTTGGNEYFAQKIADGLQALLDSTVVTTSVTGVAIPTTLQPPSVPMSDSATGTLTCNTTSVKTGLISVFNSMNSMTENGDEYFASELASLVFACVKSGVVNTAGQNTLSGVTGVGTVS